MPLCPFCKRNAAFDEGHCRACGADVACLQQLRELPATLYNQGLEAARRGHDIEAIAQLGAAAQLGGLGQAWHLLGKVLARANPDDVAKQAFERARPLPPPRLPLADAAPASVQAPPALTEANAQLEAVPAAQAAEVRPARHWLMAVLLFAGGLAVGLGLPALWMRDQAPELAGPAAALPALPTSATAPPVAASVAGAAAGVAAAVSVAAPSGGPAAWRPHAVQPGDTLWDLAARHMGDGRRWREITRADGGLPEPPRLSVGERLTIPPPLAAR